MDVRAVVQARMMENKKMNKVSLSYSSIRDLLECPSRFYWSRIMGQRIEIRSDALDYGTEFHAAIQSILAGQEVHARNDVVVKAKMLMDRYDLYDSRSEIEVSKEYRGYNVRGFVDLITDDDILYEIKTGIVNADKINSFILNPVQISFYSWLLGKSESIQEYRVLLVNSRLGLRERLRVAGKYEYIAREADEFFECINDIQPDVDLVYALLDRAIDIIEREDWYQNRVMCYKWNLCPYITYCKSKKS